MSQPNHSAEAQEYLDDIRMYSINEYIEMHGCAPSAEEIHEMVEAYLSGDLRKGEE